jgi:hypothetical protein
MYELGFYIPEDGVLHRYHRENLKYYIALTGCALYRRHHVSPVRHELGFYTPEDDKFFTVDPSTFPLHT